MNNLSTYIQSILILLSAASIGAFAIQWSVNEWSNYFSFEPVTFFQILSVIVFITIVSIIWVFVKNIVNYNK